MSAPVLESHRRATAMAFGWRTCDTVVDKWITTGDGREGVGAKAFDIAQAIADAEAAGAAKEREGGPAARTIARFIAAFGEVEGFTGRVMSDTIGLMLAEELECEEGS